jgi:hypothetical protein
LVTPTRNPSSSALPASRDVGHPGQFAAPGEGPHAEHHQVGRTRELDRGEQDHRPLEQGSEPQRDAGNQQEAAQLVTDRRRQRDPAAGGEGPADDEHHARSRDRDDQQRDSSESQHPIG